MNPIVFFNPRETGPNRVWISDGTPGSARPLGAEGPTAPFDFMPLSTGQMLFSAASAGQGRELWISDGTAEGTRLVKDINPGPDSSLTLQTEIAALGDGRAVFSADDGIHGQELWVTDGAADGTRLLRDIRPGGDSAPAHLTPLGDGRVVFFATDEAHGRELWVTDGTEAGTQLLKDIFRGPVSSREDLANSPILPLDDGRVLFVADDGVHGREPWVSDGTTGGTRLLADINPGEDGSQPHNFTAEPDGTITFSVSDGVFTRQANTDGTPEGTQWPSKPPEVPLPDSFERGPDEGIYPWDISGPVLLGNGRWLFRARGREQVTEETPGGGTSIRTINHDHAVWVSDGTSEGTRLLLRENPVDEGRGSTYFHLLSDGRAIFASTDEVGPRLWVTDGTFGAVSTLVLREGVTGLDVKSLGGGKHLVNTRMEEPEDGGRAQRPLWLLDVDPMDRDIALTQIADGHFFGLSWLQPVSDGRWIFSVRNWEGDTLVREAWITDATVVGTRQLFQRTPQEDWPNLDNLTHVSGDVAVFLSGGTAQHLNLVTGEIAALTDEPLGAARDIAVLDVAPATGLAGQLLTRGGEPLSGMTLTLSLADGSKIDVTADAGGRFAFEDAELAGAEILGPSWTAVEGPAITTGSALQVLRLAVGLQPSWGPATALDFIAADINGDGRVTTGDALDVLRVAVNLESEHAPRWKIIEADRDFGEVDRNSVPTDVAPRLDGLDDLASLTLMAFLTGNLQELF